MLNESYFLSSCLLLSIIAMFNFNSFILTWLVMEVNMSVFIVWLLDVGRSYNEESPMCSCLFYLMVQCFGSMIFLFGSFSNMGLLLDFSSGAIVCLSLCIKLSVYPFHSWFFNFCENLNPLSLFVALTYQNIPLIFIFSFFSIDEAFYIFVLNLFYGSIQMHFSWSLGSLLLFSSLYSFFWAVGMFLQSCAIGFTNYLLYSISIYLILQTLYGSNIFKGLSIKFNLFTFICYSCSLPPFNLFYLNFFFISFLFLISSYLTLLVLTSSGLVALSGYYYYFYSFMSAEDSNFFSSEQGSNYMMCSIMMILGLCLLA